MHAFGFETTSVEKTVGPGQFVSHFVRVIVRSLIGCLPLATVGEFLAVPTREEISARVQNRDAAAAIARRASKPIARSPIITRRSVEKHGVIRNIPSMAFVPTILAMEIKALSINLHMK